MTRTVQVSCAALSVVLMFLAVIFAGGYATGAAGQSSGHVVVLPGFAAPAGRATGGTVPPPLLGRSVRTTDDLLPGIPLGGYPSSFPAGECTFWASRNHPASWNGNAYQWYVAARAARVPTSSTPSVGAIVVYAPAHPYDAQFGHVAIVTDVGLGTYTVSEMNYRGWGVVDARTVQWPDAHVEGFIP